MRNKNTFRMSMVGGRGIEVVVVENRVEWLEQAEKRNGSCSAQSGGKPTGIFSLVF